MRTDAGRLTGAGRLWRHCMLVAVLNLVQHKLRLAVALLGVGVSLVLLQIQLSSLDAARAKVTLLYADFDFDIALLPATYQFLLSGGTFDRIRLNEAAAAADIATTFSLNVDNETWIDLATLRRSSCLLIGMDDPGGFVRDPAIRAGLAALGDSRAILVDRFSHPDFGSLALGTDAKVSDQDVTITGVFELGLFFYADGAVIARNVDFARLSGRPARDISIGLIRLPPGADPAAAKARLIAALPKDVRVLLHDEIIGQEQAFFVSTKPIGIMLRVGMVVAFLVGAVMLIQVLSTEIVNRTNEFAVMKAMGFGSAFVYGVGLVEVGLLALGAFLPALAVGGAVLGVVQHLTHLPAALTPLVGAEILGVALVMGVVSCVAVLPRIARADPAELY
jgi:putative ABC transport system permease protein